MLEPVDAEKFRPIVRLRVRLRRRADQVVSPPTEARLADRVQRRELVAQRAPIAAVRGPRFDVFENKIRRFLAIDDRERARDAQRLGLGDLS